MGQPSDITVCRPKGAPRGPIVLSIQVLVSEYETV